MADILISATETVCFYPWK